MNSARSGSPCSSSQSAKTSRAVSSVGLSRIAEMNAARSDMGGGSTTANGQRKLAGETLTSHQPAYAGRSPRPHSPLPPHHGGAPRQPGAEATEHHQVAFL